MKLFIASDHAGFRTKEALKADKNLGPIEWLDLGCVNSDSCHYPEFAQALAEKILSTKNEDELMKPCGILICGSGVGMSIAANRFTGIRAVLAMREDVARLSREHNATNILCLGERLVGIDENIKIAKSWLDTPFEGGRHRLRVDLIDKKFSRKT